MKEQRIKAVDLVVERYLLKHVEMCIEARAFRLLGIVYNKYVRWYIEPATMDIVFEYD